MSTGLHNAYSPIESGLTKCKPEAFGPENGGAGESHVESAAPVVPPSYLKTLRGWGQVRERFIYLAATPNNQFVKVGVSFDPERRLLDLRIAKRALYRYGWRDPRGFEWVSLRLVRTWPLGAMTQRQAFDREQAVHRALRVVARRQWGAEWYRFATSRAAGVIEQALVGLVTA